MTRLILRQTGTMSQQRLRASWIGDIAQRILKRRRAGFVFGIYGNALNLLFEHDLICIVASHVELGPLNIVLSPHVSRLSSLGLRIGDRIEARANELKFSEGFSISLDSADTYRSETKFARPVLGPNEIEANAEIARRIALQFGNMAGLGGLLDMFPNSMEKTQPPDGVNIFAAWAFPHILEMEQALQTMQGTKLSGALQGLVGLGPGLTPSGDDTLAALALLVSLYSNNSERIVPQTSLITTAISQASSRTTKLSREFLRLAALGRGNESTSRVCEAVLTGDAESVRQSTKRVLEIGETSGTDTMLGVVIGANCCTRWGSRKS